MEDRPYYFIERIYDHAWLTGSFQWTHDPVSAWKTTEKDAVEEVVRAMFDGRCIVTEHLFINDRKSFEWEKYPTKPKPTAFEWHNYETGHCYVDYAPRPNMGESDGYTMISLFKI